MKTIKSHFKFKVMKTKAFLCIIFVVLISVTTFAQENEKRFGFEFSSGASVATQKLAGTSLNTGYGFEAIFHYRILPHTGVYAGWGLNSFSADESFAGNDVCFEETGYVFGLQYKRPFGDSSLQYYLRAGGLFNHVETENTGGDIINDTGHGLGWQLAAGIDVKLGNNWSLTPGLKFNALSRDSEFDEVSRTLDYNYISLRVGVVKLF
tara:strand:+ start:30879 stop:31502 length:624 start_codon:yes stop_codon:yes gene_type:complete